MRLGDLIYNDEPWDFVAAGQQLTQLTVSIYNYLLLFTLYTTLYDIYTESIIKFVVFKQGSDQIQFW